jgi:hypothetical protein
MTEKSCLQQPPGFFGRKYPQHDRHKKLFLKTTIALTKSSVLFTPHPNPLLSRGEGKIRAILLAINISP